MNLVIGHPNRIDACTLSPSIGSWGTTLANLQIRDAGQLAVSTDDATASTKIGIDQGSAQTVRVVCLMRSNLSSAATWRVLIGSTAGASDVYAGTWTSAWLATYSATLRRDPVLVLPAGYSGRYVTIEIDDTTNPAGFVSLARVFVGGGFEPEYNASYGLVEGFQDLSSSQRTESGGLYAYDRPVLRTVRFALDLIREQTEADSIADMLRTQRTTREVYWAPAWETPANIQRRGFVGSLSRLDGFQFAGYKRRAIGFEITEIL